MDSRNDLESIVDFYTACIQLKHEIRRGWNKRGIPKEQCESILDHSFGVALLGYILSEQYFKDLDKGKLLKMALLHDLPELISQDITPLDGISSDEKRKREYKACNQLFGELPNGEIYIALWTEYEEQTTPEARLVYQLDKLEMGIQALVYEGQGFENLEPYFPDVKSKLTDDVLKQLFDYVLSLRTT
jgi:putative hydrolases of HD superfamily